MELRTTMKSNLNCREVIRAGSGTLAALALGPSHLGAADSVAAPTKRKIRKAIMYGTVGLKGSVLEKFKAIKEAGFEGVEPMSHMNQDEVVKALEATGLKTASVCCNTHWTKPVSDPNPHVRGKRSQKLHIKEFSREKANKEGLWKGVDVPFLKGDNNWPAVMKALDEIGYDGWGIAEQSGADSAEGLKKLSEEMDRIFAS